MDLKYVLVVVLLYLLVNIVIKGIFYNATRKKCMCNMLKCYTTYLIQNYALYICIFE